VDGRKGRRKGLTSEFPRKGALPRSTIGKGQFVILAEDIINNNKQTEGGGRITWIAQDPRRITLEGILLSGEVSCD